MIRQSKKNMKRLMIYVHGKGGCAKEAERFKPLFSDSDVIGFDYHAQTPWESKEEFTSFYDLHGKGYDSVVLIANSIGAFLSMNALSARKVSKALFISPIVDMEKLISDMMASANVTENELKTRKEIFTDCGETLSWEYLCYVRAHPIRWNVPTCILYGGKDSLTSKETIFGFAKRIGAELTVMEDGEHWFHTQAQLQVLDEWVRRCTRGVLAPIDKPEQKDEESAELVSSMTLTGIL